MVDTGDVDRMFDAFEASLLITDEGLDELADFMVYRIGARLSRGVDELGMPFAPYRPSTARQRARRGRETGRVTLQDTGRMVASMRGRAEDGDALIYFASKTEGNKAAMLDEGTSRMVARPFMAASNEDLDLMADILFDRMVR